MPSVDKILIQTLMEVVRFLELKEISYALIGGLAASIRGRIRTTEDVDLVIHCEIADALLFIDNLDSTHLETLFPESHEIVRRSCILPLRHQITGVTIDLAVGLSGFERQVISRATDVTISKHRIKVATAEDILLMKLMASRSRDKQDIEGIIVAHKASLDWYYCRTVGQQLQDALGIDMIPQIEELQSRVSRSKSEE